MATLDEIIAAAEEEYMNLMSHRNAVWKLLDEGIRSDEFTDDLESELQITDGKMRLLLKLGLIDTKKIPDPEMARRDNEWDNRRAEMSYAEGENEANLLR